MRPLDGRRIALLESRKSGELAGLVQRLGGTTISAPSVQEVQRSDDISIFVDGLAARRFQFVIFLTGVGATSVLEQAGRRDALDQSLEALRRATIICRGPKPIAALKRYGLSPGIVTPTPHTSVELLQALAAIELTDATVLLVHYGERNDALADGLRRRGANLSEVCPYEWQLPPDVSPLESMIEETICGRVDALLFTSQVQCRHLIHVAQTSGKRDTLVSVLNRDVVLGAIGPVCADSLRAAGLKPDVIPAAPNMAALITAVGDYFELVRD